MFPGYPYRGWGVKTSQRPLRSSNFAMFSVDLQCLNPPFFRNQLFNFFSAQAVISFQSGFPFSGIRRRKYPYWMPLPKISKKRKNLTKKFFQYNSALFSLKKIYQKKSLLTKKIFVYNGVLFLRHLRNRTIRKKGGVFFYVFPPASLSQYTLVTSLNRHERVHDK